MVAQSPYSGLNVFVTTKFINIYGSTKMIISYLRVFSDLQNGVESLRSTSVKPNNGISE